MIEQKRLQATVKNLLRQYTALRAILWEIETHLLNTYLVQAPSVYDLLQTNKAWRVLILSLPPPPPLIHILTIAASDQQSIPPTYENMCTSLIGNYNLN